MEDNTVKFPVEKKNSCAIRLMRTMLIKYSAKHQVGFENAMVQFIESTAYEMLFDFETEVWKEGPDYLMQIFEEILIDG